MNKEKLLKLFRRKTYWEKEREECINKMTGALYWFFFTTIIFLSDSLGKRVKKIKEAGWGFVGIIYSIALIGILLVTFFHLFQVAFIQLRIQKCSQKIAEINQQLLAELKNSPVEVEWK